VSVNLRAITDSEGTAPRALALADALALPPQPGADASLRALLRVGSVPRYRPERWNDDTFVQVNNNCYNYATDVRNNSFGQPGIGGGLIDRPSYCDGPVGDATLNCPDKTVGSIADGLTSTGAEPSLDGIEFGHVVALVIAPAADFHWYRRDRDGMWSHKIGPTAATNLDHSDRPISDPRTADRFRYTQFCGFFAVPRGGVAIDGCGTVIGAPTKRGRRRGDVTVVRMLVFSGRPDPEWTLDADEDAALVQKLTATRRRTRLTAAASRRPTRLGYRGFLIDRPGAVPGTRDITIVHAGVVGDVRLTSTEHRADADGIEDDLLEQARRRGFGDLLS
jgi:hypothetical protein